MGNPYDFGEKEPEPEVDDSNKMELMQMSYNNHYFLFLDKIKKRFMLYEVVPLQPSADQSKLDGKQRISDFAGAAFSGPQQNLTEEQKAPSKHRWKLQFTLKYTIQQDDSEMFQHMEVVGIDHLEFFRQNKYQIKVDNDGTVKFCFVENFPMSHHIGNDGRGDANEQPQDPMIQCRFNSSIVTHDQEKTSGTHTSFSTIIHFPRDALIKLGLTIDKQKIHIERELKKIRIEQARLPKKYFDYS